MSRKRVTDDSTHGPGMHQHMLLCCGTMTVIFGALGISSVVATVGLTAGQTYLTIAGFVLAASAITVYLYRNQSPPERNPPGSLDDIEQESR